MTSSIRSRFAMLACLLALSACREKSPLAEGLLLADGSKVSAEVLSRGEVVYVQNCAVCHGADGSGGGTSAPFMRPPPRAFKQALFKFGGVAAGELPTDEALDRIVRRGLRGTPMLGWDLGAWDRRAAIQYLKTFSPRWKEERPGEPVAISADPWLTGGGREEAIERGRALFHLSGSGHAGCVGCHPAYVTREELMALSLASIGTRPDTLPDDLHQGRARDGDHALALDAEGNALQTARVYATDLLTQPLRTVWPLGARLEGAAYTESRQREDLYRVIAAGVGGTAMPTWKGALPEADLWALVHYVQSVMQLKDTEEGRALSAKLEADAAPPSLPVTPEGG